MIKASISRINSKKSRHLLFLTLGLAECTNGPAESGQLAESTMELAESMTQKHKNRILQFSFRQLSNNLMKTKLGSDTTDGF